MYVVCEPGAPATDTLEKQGHSKGEGQKKEENTHHTQKRQKKGDNNHIFCICFITT